MANCSCSGSTGPTYTTANRGYGCLSSVPTCSGIPYNCFLPPTNMAYYQNFPFYNGPCGPVKSSGPNSCGYNWGCGCNPCNNGESESKCPESGNCNASCCKKPCCNSNCCSNSEPEEGQSTNCSILCNNPCNPCCGPAAALVTSTGTVTTTAGAAIPLTLAATAVDSSIPMPLANLTGAISVVGDSVIFNCTGIYLVILSVSLSDATSYTGTITLNVNGTPASTATQTLALSSEAYEGSSRALVRVNAGSTMTVNTSAVLTDGAAGAGSNVITLTIIRVA